jgi:hypothetical protein
LCITAEFFVIMTKTGHRATDYVAGRQPRYIAVAVRPVTVITPGTFRATASGRPPAMVTWVRLAARPPGYA